MTSGIHDKARDISPPQAIIIVRRRGGERHDSHHGGVWKIAYADFMTAMMAFFLVMWLVNSADDKTIVQVAAYFNPMRLSERVPSERGLNDGTLSTKETRGTGAPTAGGAKTKSEDASAKPAPQKSESKREAKRRAEREQQLFADPIQTLDELAAAVPSSNETRHGPPVQPSRPVPSLPDPFARGATSEPAPQDAPKGHTTVQESPQEQSDPSKGLAEGRSARAGGDAIDRIRHDVESAVLAAVAQRLQFRPHIEVRATSEGVLLSVSDDANFGMFAIGSAEPRPELVVVMEYIAAALKLQSGRIVVRGHTDNRLYKTRNYDNWRLSSARAHMAQYMLLRGGIETMRIERIEGHADQMPLNAQDRGAAENRRIEILLKVPHS